MPTDLDDVEEPDPFEPEDPDDPTTLLDPSEEQPAGPDGDPATREPGIPPPPPAQGGPVPPPSAERVSLTSASSAISSFLTLAAGGDAGVGEASLAKAQNLAEACRDSFADHWLMNKDAALATAKQLANASSTPDADLAAVTTVGTTLAQDADMVDALKTWCAARDMPSPDMGKLATAAQKVLTEAQALCSALDSDIMSGFHTPLLGLHECLRGIIAQVGAEADMMLAGERVPPGVPGEAIARRIDRQTGDGNWQDRLVSQPTWAATAKVIGFAMKAVAPTVKSADPSVETATLTSQMQALDKVLRARTLALKKGPADHATRQAVLTGYLGVVSTLERKIPALQDGLAKAGPKDSVLGMAKGDAQRVLDVWLGTLRVMRDELAADPLTQDPELAPVARRTVTTCEDLDGPTSIESGIALAQKDFRSFWRKARDTELKALRSAGVDVSALSKSFDADLGPALDAWSDEVNKFPKQNRQWLHDQALKIEQILRRSRSNIRSALAKDQHNFGLLRSLDTISAGVAKTVRSYANRGGLFG